ncbi:MAG: putative capsid protein [Circoviridae sp.]|nr:MAG: putative capsid protein [Circoviridae sp.]
MSAIVPVSQSKERAATQPYAKRRQYKKAPPRKYVKKAVSRPAPAAKSAMKSMIITLPACAEMYAETLCNPFDTLAGVCIPSGEFPLPSQKFKTIVRTTMNLGTTGFGFVCCSPSLSSDVQAFFTSSTASVGTATTQFNVFTNTVPGYAPKLPYQSIDLAAKSAQGRIVSAGIRVRFAGKEQDRSGLYSALETQDHTDLSQETPKFVLEKYANVLTSRPAGDGRWDASVCYSGPTSPHMVDFVANSYPLTDILGGAANILCISMQGQPGDLIELEYAIHAEYIGKSVGSKTATEADNKAYSTIMQSAKNIAAQGPLTPSGFSAMMSRVVDGLVKNAPKVSGVVNRVYSEITREELIARASKPRSSSLSAPWPLL